MITFVSGRDSYLIEKVKSLMINYGVNENLAPFLSNIITLTAVMVISLTAASVVRKILFRVLESYAEKSKANWHTVFTERRIFDRLVRIIPIGIIHAFAPLFPPYTEWIQRIAYSCMIFFLLLAVDGLLDGVNDIYSKFEISKIRPIKGYLQVVNILSYTVGIIVVISVFIDRSPWILLSGIGAATAVVMLIFQNSILGLVASIQLTSNNMLQIGDWIEMPKYGADGNVLEITLHTVKIQNSDKTITYIPTHAFMQESFKNWRGMMESGGRRIKRAIHIDVTSIKLCDEALLSRLENIPHIHKYIKDKRKEITEYHTDYNGDHSYITEGSHLTNIGIFRIYIENYLKNHPKVSKDMTQVVRQLSPGENGLPVEIYAFTNEIAWSDYERIQSDIFEHLLAVVPEFDLRIYQKPSGYDVSHAV